MIYAHSYLLYKKKTRSSVGLFPRWGGVGGTYLRERGRKLRDFLHSGESVCIPLQNCDSSQFLFCGHVKSNRIQSRD